MKSFLFNILACLLLALVAATVSYFVFGNQSFLAYTAYYTVLFIIVHYATEGLKKIMNKTKKK